MDYAHVDLVLGVRVEGRGVALVVGGGSGGRGVGRGGGRIKPADRIKQQISRIKAVQTWQAGRWGDLKRVTQCKQVGQVRNGKTGTANRYRRKSR